MKQEFQTFNTNLGTLFLGDSKEVLKTLPTASVDTVITDPPWGVGMMNMMISIGL
jgi:DNA modification methylase